VKCSIRIDRNLAIRIERATLKYWCLGFVAWLIRCVYYANLSSSFPEVPSATEIKERWKGEQIYTLRYQNDFALR